jgi:hypothetical protein
LLARMGDQFPQHHLVARVHGGYVSMLDESSSAAFTICTVRAW